MAGPSFQTVNDNVQIRPDIICSISNASMNSKALPATTFSRSRRFSSRMRTMATSFQLIS